MPDVIACLIADEFPYLFDMEGNDYARQHKLENVAAKIQSHIDELTEKQRDLVKEHHAELQGNFDMVMSDILKTHSDLIDELTAKHEAELKALCSVLEEATLELESWNLQQGDKDTIKIIAKCGKAILSARINPGDV